MAYPEAWLWKAIETAAGCPTYPAYVPREAKPPYVAFARVGTLRERHMDGNAAVPVASFTVTAVAAQYLETKQLARQVRLGIDGFAGQTPAGVQILSAAVTDETDADPEQYAGDDRPTYAVNLSLDVRFHEET